MDGTKSLNGKPILANDPHLRIQIPSTWYQVHLIGAGINVVGVSFPGSPYVVIGHNERVAWGFTNLMADSIDLFVEKINPENREEYWHLDRWEKIETKNVKIGIKGKKEAVVREIQRTKHGPIISDLQKGVDITLSMKWVPQEADDAVVKGLSTLNRAANIASAKEAGRYVKIYALNMILADVDGNIAYRAIGGIPKRTKGTGKFPAPGWSGEYDWKGFVKPEELPQFTNPSEHFIVTANNKIVSDSYPYTISNSWASPYRYERIVSMLNEREKLSVEDFKRIQMDTYSIPAEKLVKAAVDIKTKDPEIRWFLEEFRNWNYEVKESSLPALLYEVTRVNLIKNTFLDELRDIYPDFLDTFIFNYGVPDKILSDPHSRWWDDVGTSEHEAMNEIIHKSIKDTLREIKGKIGSQKDDWTWGKLHRNYFVHPLGRVKFLDKIFNYGPTPASGDPDTVNNTHFSYRRPYDVVIIPSYRMIMDLSDINSGLWIIPTGQSGNPFSRYYTNMTGYWTQGKYYPMLFSHEDIETNKRKELMLLPR